MELWVRNLLNDDNPIAAFRDIYWTNNDDIQKQNIVKRDPLTGQRDTPTGYANSNFDDFPPWRLSVSYPNLRTYGLVAKVRFGGAEK